MTERRVWSSMPNLINVHLEFSCLYFKPKPKGSKYQNTFMQQIWNCDPWLSLALIQDSHSCWSLFSQGFGLHNLLLFLEKQMYPRVSDIIGTPERLENQI